MKTLRVCPDNLRHVKEESLVCGDASQPRKPLGSRMMMSARLVAGQELSALMPSVLDRAFKGEL